VGGVVAVWVGAGLLAPAASWWATDDATTNCYALSGGLVLRASEPATTRAIKLSYTSFFSRFSRRCRAAPKTTNKNWNRRLFVRCYKWRGNRTKTITGIAAFTSTTRATRATRGDGWTAAFL